MGRLLTLFIVLLAAAAIPARAGDRALLVGLDHYSEPSLDNGLNGAAANDVSAVKGMLLGRYGYKPDQLRILTDKDATRAAILGSIDEWLGRGSKAGDRAFLYFAGLGHFVPDANGDEADGLDEALVPFDAKLGAGGGRPSLDNLLSDDEVSKAIGALSGRNVTVVLDASFSGRVTRGKASGIGAARTPDLGATRSIAVEPRVAKQKAEEGGFVEAELDAGSLAVWSAASASQAALIEERGGKPGGLFTALLVEAIGEAKADANRNGSISNVEVLSYVADGSKAFCDAHGSRCEMGLSPRLDPPSALGLTAFGEAGREGKNVAHEGRKPDRLTLDRITDYLAKGNPDKVELRQDPPSPVKVGARDIRFQVLSPHEGFLILLDLTDDGELTQLYPNEFSRKHESKQAGMVRAGSPLTVPDAYYGLKFNATKPSKGYVVAIVARDRVEFGEAVKTRSIQVIPRKQAVEQFLPELAQALGRPLNATSATENTKLPQFSVATFRYEILP